MPILNQCWQIMSLVNKIYRLFSNLSGAVRSKLRVYHYRLKYPSLSIDSASKIGPGCEIICVDGSQVSITNSQIGFGSFIVVEAGATLKISDSSVGPYSVIVAHEYIEIKSHCSIAEMVVIRDQNHKYANGRLIRDSGYETGKIIINENVWIGAKATILKNVNIGQNSVIGANSLVNKSYPENSLIAGVPAKTIVKK